MVVRICMLMYLFTIQVPGTVQAQWQLSKNKNGIKVYTKPSDSSDFRSVKVEGVFTGTWERLLNIVTDVDNHPHWVFNAKKAYLIKKISDREMLYYTETALPWPVHNRDVVIRMKFIHEAGNNLYTIQTAGEPDALPVKEGLVRVPYFRALWQVRVLDKHKLAITYFLDLHSGGSVPAWMVNLFAVKGPYETFSKLAGLLNQ